MSTAEQTLVIILSSFLGLFLLLGIIIAILMIKLLNKVRGVVDSAQTVSANLEAATDSFRSAAGPMAFSRIVGTLYGAYRGVKGKKR
jgi:hypothetical protein